jgi:hypothetical protein
MPMPGTRVNALRDDPRTQHLVERVWWQPFMWSTRLHACSRGLGLAGSHSHRSGTMGDRHANSRLCQAPHCRRLTVGRPPSSSALAQLSGGTPAVHKTVLHTYTPADPRTHHTCLHTEHSSRETSHIFNTVWTHACDTVFAFDQCSIIDRVYIGTHAVHSTVPGAVQPRSILPHSVMISNVRSSSHLSAFG